MKIAEERDPSSAMLRGLELLEKIAAAGRPLTLAELSVLANLPKPTVHRLCQKLEAERFLAREPGGRHYVVGPRLFSVSLNALRSGANADRRLILEKLVKAIGETCNFTALVQGEVLYLDRVEARWPLRLHLEPGSRVPMHCTASGKLFLANLSDDRRLKALETLDLSAFTQNTMTTAQALQTECVQIRKQGFSLDREEFLLGLFAIAVPVRDEKGSVVAAIACHGPSVRFGIDNAMVSMPLLLEAAEHMRSTIAA